MKTINFKKIAISNFLSIGKDPVTIDFTPGVHLITGINKDKGDRKNGLGKSSIMEAVHFALFGTATRDIKKDGLVNNVYNKATCKVSLQVEVIDSTTHQYVIERTLQPSKCLLYKDGVDITLDSIANTTQYFADLIHLNPIMVQNCILMSMNASVPFMSKTKVEKRKFIESIFNLDVFSNMLQEVRLTYNESKQQWNTQNAVIREITSTCNMLEKQKEIEETQRKEKIERQKTILNDYVEQYNHIEETPKVDEKDFSEYITAKEKLSKRVEQIETKKDSLISEKSRYNYDIENHKKEIVKIKKSSGVCPTCKRAYEDHDTDSNEKHIKLLQEQINDSQEKFNKTQEQYNSLINSYKEYKVKIEKIDKAIQNHQFKLDRQASEEKRKVSIIRQIKQLKEDIKLLKEQKSSYETLLIEKQKELDVQQKQIKDLDKQMSILDAAKFVVSEEGVKSIIVKKLLELFNSRIDFYLKKLDANCTCKFNEFFEEIIVNERNKECSYFNFSSAERKSIDLACLFAFLDMRRLQGEETYNLSFYDEFFDSCLDEKGLNLVMNILREKEIQYQECIMVISHRQESMKSITGDIIYLQKQNGITTRVPYEN